MRTQLPLTPPTQTGPEQAWQSPPESPGVAHIHCISPVFPSAGPYNTLSHRWEKCHCLHWTEGKAEVQRVLSLSGEGVSSKEGPLWLFSVQGFGTACLPQLPLSSKISHLLGVDGVGGVRVECGGSAGKMQTAGGFEGLDPRVKQP